MALLVSNRTGQNEYIRKRLRTVNMFGRLVFSKLYQELKCNKPNLNMKTVILMISVNKRHMVIN